MMHALNIPSLCSQAIEVNKMREREREIIERNVFTPPDRYPPFDKKLDRFYELE